MSAEHHIIADRWVKKFNASVEDYIGSGVYASVYSLIGNNRVVKVTTDEDEIETSRLVMEAQSRGLAQGIVKIYAREEIDDCLCLLEERLSPLPDQLVDAMKHVSVTDLPVKVIKVKEPYMWDSDYVAPSHPKRRGRWVPAKTDPLVQSFRWTNAVSLNLLEIIKSLKEAGIKSYTDWHSGNVMIRPGYGVVVSDLGRTVT